MTITENPARFNEQAVWRLAIKHEAAAAVVPIPLAMSYQPPTFTRSDHVEAAELLKETVTAFTDARERMLGQIADLRAALGILAEAKRTLEQQLRPEAPVDPTQAELIPLTENAQ